MHPLLRPHPLRVLLAVFVLPAALFAEKPFAFAGTPGQLPKDVVPRHYALRIQPDLDARTTTGTARIELEVLQPVRELVLNAHELAIDSAALADNPAAPGPLTPRLDPAKQTLTLPVELSAGRHTITIAYRGKIGTQAEGFFIDKYPTPTGDKLMLGTQFEPTDARRVFPCWDEPVYRATYDITLVVPEKLMAVANTPIVRETALSGGLKEVVFARTPAMASYLVALYAGEFETVEGEQDGVKLRIITTEGKRASAAYALECTKRILAYYNRYFGVRYPLPKLDQIAVPNAFATFGAMENWGCITYIDTALLFDPVNSSQERRERVFAVIAHEMAHQWFGDLVTMAWWDNLWLNEGFASWMGTKSSDALNPEWQLWLRANAAKEGAMALDARKTTHPIQQPIANESQATDAFDTISYEKGAAVLRMVEAFVSPDVFRRGVNAYLRKFAYSNATAEDFWQIIAQTSGRPVNRIMPTFVDQAGEPLVTVKAECIEPPPQPVSKSRGKKSRRKPTPLPPKTQITVSQQRFFADPSGPNDAQNSSDAKELWSIPICIKSTEGKPFCQIFSQRRQTVPFTGCSPWVFTNANAVGYYRTQYDANTLQKLGAVAMTELSTAERTSLINDESALMGANKESIDVFLDLVAALNQDQERSVLESYGGSPQSMNHYPVTPPDPGPFPSWLPPPSPPPTENDA